MLSSGPNLRARVLQQSLKSSHPSKTTATLHSDEHKRQHDANPAVPLQVLSEKLDVLRLAFYTAPISCGVLVPVFFLREVGAHCALPAGSFGLPFRSCCHGAVMPCGQDAAPLSCAVLPLGYLPVPPASQDGKVSTAKAFGIPS